MKIAITGGSGTIGNAVIALGLRLGHKFVNIDSTPPANGSSSAAVPFLPVNVTNYNALEQALRGGDALIHLAAITRPDLHPDHEVHNTNVVGSYNALRAAAAVGMTRICQASSVNAIGHAYSSRPHYDYFPINELHPIYNDDPYGLSKWIGEQQADAIVRRYTHVSIATLRFHWVVGERSEAGRVYADPRFAAINLTAYTRLDAAARACLLSLAAPFHGHEVFFIVAPDTAVDCASLDLARTFYPDVPVRGDLSGNRSFFDSTKAGRLLGWSHQP